MEYLDRFLTVPEKGRERYNIHKFDKVYSSSIEVQKLTSILSSQLMDHRISIRILAASYIVN